jgi:hypothetical protein
MQWGFGAIRVFACEILPIPYMVKIFETQRKGGSRGFGDDVAVGGLEIYAGFWSDHRITRFPDHPIFLFLRLLCSSAFQRF